MAHVPILRGRTPTVRFPPVNCSNNSQCEVETRIRHRPLDNALVRDTVARLIAEVYAGRTQPRIATGLTPLLSLQLRAIETTEWERRLAEVERQLRG
jgi:hypothetical protein